MEKDKRAIEIMYAGKKVYVERILAAALRPLEDFDKIEYARDAVTGEEVVKLTEAIGWAWYINATGMSEDEILKAVCRMVLKGRPAALVSTKQRMREVNRLFR